MPTPVFCCGFECGVSASTGAHWQALGAGITMDTTIKRTGNRSLKVSASGALLVGTVALSSSGNWVFRVYVRFENLPTNATTAIAYVTLNSQTCGAYFNISDNKIYAGAGPAGSPTLGSTGVSIITGRWYRIDVKVSASTTSVDVMVDGVACGQAVNVSATGTATRVILGTIAGNVVDIYFDDVLISQTLADYPLGDGHVRHFVPTSDGTHNIAGTGDFQRTLTGTDILNATTTAFQLIDDVPLESGSGTDWINLLAPPNATDYVECVFGPAPGVPAATYGPRAVDFIAAYHQAATGTGNMEIRINDNGTMSNLYSATTVAGVTTIAYVRGQRATAIAGGGAWGVTSGNGNFNNLRVRFGSPAAVDANPDQYLDGIMIEAEFADRPQKITNVKQAVNRSNTY